MELDNNPIINPKFLHSDESSCDTESDAGISPLAQFRQQLPSWPDIDMQSIRNRILSAIGLLSLIRKKEENQIATTSRRSQLGVQDVLSRLPREIFLEILLYLDLQTLFTLACVSKYCRHVSTHDHLWKRFYQQACQEQFEFETTDSRLHPRDQPSSAANLNRHRQVQAAHALQLFLKDSSNEEPPFGHWKALYFEQGFSQKELFKVRKYKAQQFKKKLGWVYQAKSVWGLILTGTLLVLKLDGWISIPWLHLFLPSAVPFFFTTAAIMLDLYAEFRFPRVHLSVHEKKRNTEELVAVGWFMLLFVVQSLALLLRLEFKIVSWEAVATPLLMLIFSIVCWITWKHSRTEPPLLGAAGAGCFLAIAYCTSMNYLALQYDVWENLPTFASVILAWFAILFSTGFLPSIRVREVLIGVWFVAMCIGSLCTFIWFLAAKLDGAAVFSVMLPSVWRAMTPLWLLDLTFMTFCVFAALAPSPFKAHWNLSQRDSRIGWWLLFFILVPFVLYQIWVAYRIENNLPAHAALMFVVFAPFFLLLGSAGTLLIR